MNHDATTHASPRPWRVRMETLDIYERHGTFAHVEDANGETICTTVTSRCDADAALIVDAVNAAEAWRVERRRLELAAAGAERAFVVADARRTLLERYYCEVFADRARLRDLVRRMATQLSRSCPEKFGDWTRQGDNACSLVREARAAIGEGEP